VGLTAGNQMLVILVNARVASKSTPQQILARDYNQEYNQESVYESIKIGKKKKKMHTKLKQTFGRNAAMNGKVSILHKLIGA
jgi:hypothetical protein